MILNTRRGDVDFRSTFDSWPGFSFGANPISVPPPGWSGGRVTRDQAAGVPAANLAIRIAAEQVSSMCAGVFRGDGLDRVEVSRAWQAQFFNGEPNEEESWETVWGLTEASLTAENNAYWWLQSSGGRVSAVTVMDPQWVAPMRDPETGLKVFDVQVGAGRKRFDDTSILHFRGVGGPGQPAAPNPLDLCAESLGAAAQRIRYEGRFYDQGLGLAMAVTMPQNVGQQQAREYRDLMHQTHGGAGNAHKVMVFPGGTQVSTVGVSPRDAQFIEAMNFTVQEVARIYNVWPSILGDSTSKASGLLTPEQEMTRWHTFGLSPRLRRIAGAINHSKMFFGSGPLEFGWEADDDIKGDVATENAIAVARIQAGMITPNEWRASKGLKSLGPVGDIVQVTPVGGAPNPGAVVVPTGMLAPNDDEPAAELDD